MAAIKKSDLYSSLWASCDALRGGMDASQYKDYILTLLFVKYVSDKFKGQRYAAIEIPEGGSFDDMVKIKGDKLKQKNIGEEMDKIIAKLAEKNDLRGVIDNAHFNDESKLGKGQEMVDKLTKLIDIFRRDELNFKNNRAEGDDIIGDAYEYLMRKFATESGKSKGQFYTPAEVSRILSKVIGIKNEMNTRATVYDPACGSGSLLIKALEEAPINLAGYGQEKENTTAGLAKMNNVLHGRATTIIKADNTFSNPQYFENDENKEVLKRFDYIVANPPFSIKNWTDGLKEYGRFDGYGAMPPEKNGDYAWLMHIIKSLKDTGKAAVILPHGVLFRGNAEAKIRETIINKGYIKGIISLPANLFYGTSIPACIIVLDKETADTRDSIFIIDASHDYIKDGNKNRLRERDVYKIVKTFNNQIEDDPKYARKVPLSEIKNLKNNYNLNIPRYIDSSDKEDIQDINAHMKGGIPKADIDKMSQYWEILGELKTKLVSEFKKGYYKIKVPKNEINEVVFNDHKFEDYSKKVGDAFSSWQNKVHSKLVNIDPKSRVSDLIIELSEIIIDEFKDLKLLDKYDVYQVLLGYWQDVMADDVYLVSQEGYKVAKEIDTIYVTKKVTRDGQTTEEKTDKVKNWDGKLLSRDLIVQNYFPKEKDAISQAELILQTTSSKIDEMVENAEEGTIFFDLIGEDGKIKEADLKKAIKENKNDPEVKTLLEYNSLLSTEKDQKKIIKELNNALENMAKNKYELLSIEEIKELLVNKKWYYSIYDGVSKLFENVSREIANRVNTLADRYENTLGDIEERINETAKELSSLLGDLTANEFDLSGLQELKILLGGK